MKNKSTMKWVGLSIILLIYIAGSSYLKKINAEGDKAMEGMMVRSHAMDSIHENMKDLQKDLPQKFTNGNSLDQVKFDEENRQVLYYFTFANLESSTEEDINNLQIEMKQQMMTFWKNDKSKFAFIDAGVSNKYFISDKTKKEVFNFTVKPEEMQ